MKPPRTFPEPTTIPSIQSGIYTMTVEAPGFKKFETSGNKFDAAAPATMDAVMQVGAVSDTITVEANGAIKTRNRHARQDGRRQADLRICR